MMSQTLSPDVVVYLCTNCIPHGVNLPRQWSRDGARILTIARDFDAISGENTPGIEIVVHWFEELKRLVPAR